MIYALSMYSMDETKDSWTKIHPDYYYNLKIITIIVMIMSYTIWEVHHVSIPWFPIHRQDLTASIC